MATDDLLFVEHAVKRGLVSEEQVDEIMRIQEKVAEMGVPDSIPALMVKRGVLKAEDAEKVMAELRPKAKKEQIPGYRLLRRLGHGGMGSVYLARQVAMDRLVALKVLRPSLTKDPQQIERLHREAQLVGRLSHPNIVGGLDRGEAGGFQYFAMEYIEGVTLKDRLNPPRPMGETEALKVVRCVAQALDHAWSHRITHRDIKPGNILLRADGTACVMDYGLAKGPLDVSLTVTGTTLGTPQYLSPEQAKNPRGVDIRTDIYALGATLFHMLTGKPPFNGENLAEIVTQVLMKPHDPPQSLNPKISRDAAFLIDKMMAKDPRNRHATPRDLLRDLEAIERGRTIVPAGWEGDWKTFVLKRRMRRLFIGIATVIVAIVVVGGWLFWSAEQDRARLRQEQAARDYAAMLKEPPDFDSIAAHLKSLEDYTRIHGDLEPRFRIARDEWKKMLAIREDVLGEMNAFRARYEPRDEFAYWRAALLELEGDYQEDTEAIEVIRERLGDEIQTVLDLAGRRAVELYESTRGDDYRSVAEYVSRLRSLREKLVEHWPTAPTEILDAIDDRLPHAVVLQERLESLAKLMKTGIRKAIDEFRFKDAWDDLKDWNAKTNESAAIEAALPVLPRKVRELRTTRYANAEGFVVEADRARTVQLDEAGARLLAESNDPAAFEGMIDVLERQEPQAIGGSREGLAELRERIESERAERLERAQAAHAARIDEIFYDNLRRRPDAAGATLDELENLKDARGRFLAPWIAEKIRAARQDYEQVDSFWTSLKEALRKDVGRPATDLTVATIGRGQWTLVALEGWTIRLRNQAGVEEDHHLHAIGLESALRKSGLAGRKGERMKPEEAIIRFILEPRGAADVRKERARIENLRECLPEGRYARDADEMWKRLDAQQKTREARALTLLEEADEYFEKGDWLNARRGYERLNSQKEYRHTDKVEESANHIEGQLQRCDAKLEGNKTSKARFPHGGRFEYLGPNTRPNEARASVTWPLDGHPEIFALGLDADHAKIATVPAPDPEGFLGPPAPGEVAAVAGPRERSVLVLLQGETPKEYLQHHPIELTNPFLVGAPMSLEVDICSPVPVFTAISLGGYVCAILSQRNRVEGGAGVAFFTARKLTDLDEFEKLQGLRHPERRKSLENAKSPMERLELTRKRFFWMKPDRWYRLRFEKREREATLRVDGRVVGTWRLPTALPMDRNRIVLLTYTTTLLDNLRIEGTVDSQWLRGRGR